MQIGPIPDELWTQAGEIWSLAFEYRPQSYWDSFLKDQTALQHFGAFEGKQVHAVVGIHDFEARLFDQWLPCGGIAGVASAPGRRGEGLVRQVIAYCLSRLHEKKIPLAMLGTGIPAFYERMGFASTDWHYSVEASTQALKKFKAIGKSWNYRMIPRDDYALCMEVHDRWTERCPLSIRRSDHRWHRLVFGRDRQVQLFGHADGYMLVDLKATQAEKKFVVNDFAYLTDEAYYDGLALLSQMGSQFQSVRWVDSDAERLFQKGMLSECPRIMASPGMMSRVVHLPAFSQYFQHSLDNVELSDPLGITAKSGTEGLSPGQLLQLVTGFWRHPPGGWPSELNGIASSGRAFTCEMF